MLLKRPKYNLEDFRPQISIGDQIKRTRILVIDDNEDEFPFKVLRAEGFSIDYWPDIKDLSKLEHSFYDIIILDICGIGLEYDEANEGVGILRHIKRVNPAQIVVAYSGQAHESSRIPFFKLADQYVPKPANALTWRECLDDLIQTKLTTHYFWNCLKQILEQNDCSQDQIKSIEQLVIRVVKGKKINLNHKIQQILGTVDNLATVVAIAAKIASIAST